MQERPFAKHPTDMPTFPSTHDPKPSNWQQTQNHPVKLKLGVQRQHREAKRGRHVGPDPDMDKRFGEVFGRM